MWLELLRPGERGVSMELARLQGPYMCLLITLPAVRSNSWIVTPATMAATAVGECAGPQRHRH